MFIKVDQQALLSFRTVFKNLLFYIYMYIYIYIYIYICIYIFYYSLPKIMVAYIIVLI